MKKLLSFEELETQTAVELPDRELMAVAVGGLAAVAIDRIDVDVPITVEENNICVNVAAVGSAAAQGCET